LTKKGRKQLEEESESWTRLAGAVAAIMSTME
jgi:hypothetical protein